MNEVSSAKQQLIEAARILDGLGVGRNTMYTLIRNTLGEGAHDAYLRQKTEEHLMIGKLILSGVPLGAIQAKYNRKSVVHGPALCNAERKVRKVLGAEMPKLPIMVDRTHDAQWIAALDKAIAKHCLSENKSKVTQAACLQPDPSQPDGRNLG
jgi:hypothetical protein